MRLIILFILFSFFTQSKSSIIGSGLDTIKNAIDSFSIFLQDPAGYIKKSINMTQQYNILTEYIQNVITEDKIVEIIMSTIAIEDITKRNNSFKSQQNFNKTVNKTNLEPGFQKPELPKQQFFKNRQEQCNSVCQQWYNVICFLIMRCEQKLIYFKDKMTFPTIILGVVLICSFGAYLFNIFSHYFLLMLQFFTQMNLILNASIRVCISVKHVIYKFLHRKDNKDQQHPEQEIQPPPTAERFVR